MPERRIQFSPGAAGDQRNTQMRRISLAVEVEKQYAKNKKQSGFLHE